MALTTLATGIKALLDAANPNELASLLQQIKIGSALRSGKAQLRNILPAASPYQLATLQSIVLPDDAKGAVILRAFGRTATGTGVAGELAPQAAYATPTAQQIAVAPNGDIVLLLAAGWTSVDVLYEPAIVDTVELFLPVVPGTGVCVLPTTVNGLSPYAIEMVMEAEVLAGGVVGKNIVIAPGATPTTTKQANLSAAKTQLQFVVADAVTSCRVKLGVQCAVDTNILLESVSTGAL